MEKLLDALLGSNYSFLVPIGLVLVFLAFAWNNRRSQVPVRAIFSPEAEERLVQAELLDHSEREQRQLPAEDQSSSEKEGGLGQAVSLGPDGPLFPLINVDLQLGGRGVDL